MQVVFYSCDEIIV